jgi:hypothetical protein
MAQLAIPNCRETGGFGRSHSLSFDHRRRPETLRTAMATGWRARQGRVVADLRGRQAREDAV